jgi:hypothetical protein
MGTRKPTNTAYRSGLLPRLPLPHASLRPTWPALRLWPCPLTDPLLWIVGAVLSQVAQIRLVGAHFIVTDVPITLRRGRTKLGSISTAPASPGQQGRKTLAFRVSSLKPTSQQRTRGTCTSSPRSEEGVLVSMLSAPKQDLYTPPSFLQGRSPQSRPKSLPQPKSHS